MRKRGILWLLVGLAVAVLVLWPRPSEPETNSRDGSEPGFTPTSIPPPAPVPPPPPIARPGDIALRTVSPAPLAHPDDRSPLADKINAPEQDIGQDLDLVLNLFENYRRRYGGIPTGEDNVQIIRALTGNNPQRIAFIPEGSKVLNARGELTDRWGTPFFFHLLSSDGLEIRSAGADTEFYTEDDAVVASPSLRGLTPEL